MTPGQGNSSASRRGVLLVSEYCSACERALTELRDLVERGVLEVLSVDEVDPDTVRRRVREVTGCDLPRSGLLLLPTAVLNTGSECRVVSGVPDVVREVRRWLGRG